MTPVPTAETLAVGPGPESHVTTGPLEPGAPFGGRYRILRVLGAGGMGVVYQAWDEELGVAVALKVIRPEITSDPYAARDIERRFKRELLLARQVTHKHVVRIHDLGEVDGIKYLTMPFVEGRDLAGILREGALPVPRALHFARQIAAGLEAAHDAGVVHRDLKPENIMVDADDQALIMDFGISRSATSGGATMTAQGAVVGTLEYMAPEQGRGVPVDHRADLYAFGLIVYDMIVGRHRLDAQESAIVEMMSRMQQAPAPLKSRVPQVPDALSAIVMRCLEPDVEKRFATTGELVKALEGLDAEGRPLKPAALQRPLWWRVAVMAAAVTIVGLAVGLGWMWRVARHVTATTAARPPVSVLIADFDNRAGDPVFDGSLEQPLAIAMEGASFITALPRRDALRVAAQIKPDARLTQEMAQLVSRREGVNVILAGSIERQGDGYRITVKAIDALPNREIASVTRDADSKAQVLDVVGKLAANIRSDLGDTEISSGAIAAEETFTAASLEAVREYSLAQDLASAGRDEDAIVHYRKATELDAEFGRAYSGWALSAFNLGRSGEAGKLWTRALSLMNRMTEREKYRTLGLYYVAVAGDYEQAIENYTKLVSLYPADSVGHSNLAVAEFLSLNFAKAVEEGQRALAIYPKSPKFRNNLALYAMYAGEFERAAKEARAVIEQSPSYVKAFLPLAAVAMASDNIAEARTAYTRMAATPGRGESLANMGLADVALYQGRSDEAISILEKGIELDRKAHNNAFLAAKYIALAEAYQLSGRTKEIPATVSLALEQSRGESVLVAGASLLAQAGRAEEARALGAELGGRVPNQSRAYAAIVEAQLALEKRKVPDAIEALRRSIRLADLWLARFRLGVADVSAGLFAQGVQELEDCLKRRGEATAVFLDDQPSFRYLPPVYYWLGRAQEGLQMKSAAADNFKRYIAIRSAATNDPLLNDARKRVNR